MSAPSPRRFLTARVASGSGGAALHELTTAEFRRMQQEQPRLASLLQTALLRWTCRWAAADVMKGRRQTGRDRD
eukprot:SAG11_NODE_16287_length_552_cov_0.891832_1_plen_74_part_00